MVLCASSCCIALIMCRLVPGCLEGAWKRQHRAYLSHFGNVALTRDKLNEQAVSNAKNRKIVRVKGVAFCYIGWTLMDHS